MLYCPGKGQELLSALGVNLECHASSIFLVLKPPLSIIDALSKSIAWLLAQTWLAILEPFAAVFTFLRCSFFLVLNVFKKMNEFKNIQANKTRRSTVLSPEELVGTFFKMVEGSESRKSFASLPYIKGVTEPLTRVLKKHDITVVNKPLITLQQQFPAPKFRPSLESQTNVVYKIPCGDCSWCYIGETGRAFNPYGELLFQVLNLDRFRPIESGFKSHTCLFIHWINILRKWNIVLCGH